MDHPALVLAQRGAAATGLAVVGAALIAATTVLAIASGRRRWIAAAFVLASVELSLGMLAARADARDPAATIAIAAGMAGLIALAIRAALRTLRAIDAMATVLPRGDVLAIDLREREDAPPPGDGFH